MVAISAKKMMNLMIDKQRLPHTVYDNSRFDNDIPRDCVTQYMPQATTYDTQVCQPCSPNFQRQREHGTVTHRARERKSYTHAIRCKCCADVVLRCEGQHAEAQFGFEHNGVVTAAHEVSVYKGSENLHAAMYKCLFDGVTCLKD